MLLRPPPPPPPAAARPRSRASMRASASVSAAPSVALASGAAPSLAPEAAVPSLVVFDLDACVWLPEMYLLRAPPGEWDEAAGGVRAGEEVVRLFPGALHALRALASEPRFARTRLALASSTSRPSYARAVLEAYRLGPGGETFASRVSFAELYPIPHKRAHFGKLARASGVSYAEMLFFDDCSWSDNVGEVAEACPGVVGVRTPDGLTVERWEEGLAAYARAHEARRRAAGGAERS